jgi:glycosyltransferase involved in cell wall biosynthesis
MAPFFSVFTPVFNSEKFIRECIESVLHQTFSNFEWFIYDDGSTDKSYDICQKFAQREKRIILSRGENGHSIEQMNRFIDKAKGEYILFIDNDDVWDLDYLDSIYTRLVKNDVDCIITSYSLIDADGKELGWYTPTLKDGEIIDKKEVKRRFLTTLDIEGFRWNKIYKRETIQKSGIKSRKLFPADIVFEYELINYIQRAELLNNKGYFYRQSSGSQVGKIDAYKTSRMLATFMEIGDTAIKEGFSEEGWYYKSWRYINSMFLRLKNKRLTKHEIRLVFDEFSWRRCVGRGLFSSLLKFMRYENKREGHLAFSIKTVYVWMMAKCFSRWKNEHTGNKIINPSI